METIESRLGVGKSSEEGKGVTLLPQLERYQYWTADERYASVAKYTGTSCGHCGGSCHGDGSCGGDGGDD